MNSVLAALRCAVLTGAAFLLCATGQAAGTGPIVIGSKTFTESYLLAEIMAQTLEGSGFQVVRQFGFGGTLICFEALARGEIDVYPEYTGTISQTILALSEAPTFDALNEALDQHNLQALAPLGFNNSYALAVSGRVARNLGLQRISQLRNFPQLRIGLSHEFRNRADGWPGLATRYGLTQSTSGIEHGLAYQAIRDARLDVTDAYVTDGDIPRYDLRILEDDLRFFPAYLAVPLASRTLPPAARDALDQLSGQLDDALMRDLNGRVAVDRDSFETVAAGFLASAGIRGAGSASRFGLWSRLWRNTWVHLQLTGIALLLASIAGIALALAVYRYRALSRAVLYVAGLMQTIPSIALLALMIPLFGVGRLPAIVALFLYSLLPILRSTITALITIDPVLRDVARGLGLSGIEQVRHVLMPLALPNLLTGVRTAAIISIGTATLAAFIGAGGLGQPIVTGLALNDVNLILQGAVPAAILAIITEFAFELLERRLLPAHMLEH